MSSGTSGVLESYTPSSFYCIYRLSFVLYKRSHVVELNCPDQGHIPYTNTFTVYETWKLDEVPVNAEIAPKKDLESPKYRRR